MPWFVDHGSEEQGATLTVPVLDRAGMVSSLRTLGLTCDPVQPAALELWYLRIGVDSASSNTSASHVEVIAFPDPTRSTGKRASISVTRHF